MSKHYTGKQIVRAGETLSNYESIGVKSNIFSDAMDVLSYWRFSHEVALRKAFTLLQEISLQKDKKAIFAKRLKRHISIVKKLLRFENMKLRGMQDIGGCRAVLTNQKKLRQTVRDLRKRPEFKGDEGKVRYKDYIKNPKEDGYRSYHLIGKFSDSEGSKKNIEIQLRTRIQHYWATALEIVDLFTDQALKSNQGDEIWKIFFLEVSEQFSVMDNIHMFDTLSREEQYSHYQDKLKDNDKLLHSCKVAQDHCRQLAVFDKLNAFAGSLNVVDDQLSAEDRSTGYVLLEIDVKKRRVNSQIFSIEESKEAKEKYIEAEKEASSKESSVVALVSTTAVGDIKEVYPNYFADSSEFMHHLEFINYVDIVRPPKTPFLNP